MFCLLVATAYFAVSTLASPLKATSPERGVADGGFSLAINRKNSGKLLSGLEVVSKTYRKYGARLPNDQGSGADTALKIKVDTSVGTVTASPNEYDQEYLSPVWVGGQLLTLDLDTGSSDFWVYTSELPASAQVGHSVYNPNKSSTARFLPNETWEVQYGDGSSASGDVWTDCVWIGGAVVEQQAVETANTISSEFAQDPDSDGIVGLGFDALNSVIPTTQHTFITNTIAQGLPQPLFTVVFKYRASGSYDFGFIDQSKYSGSLTYTPVDATDGYWRFNTSSFGFRWPNGTSEEYPWIGDSIADTGTSIIFMDNNIAQGYWSTVSSAAYNRLYGGYVFDCQAANTLPDLHLGIDNYTAIIPGYQMAYAPVADGSTTCFGSLQSNAGLPFQILGDTFLKNVFAVFNAGTPPSLGLANQV